MVKIEELTHGRAVETAEVNALFLIGRAGDLIVRDLERRFRDEGSKMRGEDKMWFNRLFASFRSAKAIYEQIAEPKLVDSCAKDGSRSAAEWYDEWNLEANELVRLILLYIDRNSSPANVAELFALLDRQKGDGAIGKEDLERFIMK